MTTLTKTVENWRIEILIDENRVILHKANVIREDNIVVARFPHSILHCSISDLDDVLDKLTDVIEESQP